MDPESQIAAVLNRPASERLREYKYRFAQSTVFGLPVVALHFFGPMLGGPEAGRWVGMLQILLAGWVMYVGAMGMLVEGIMLKKFTANAGVAAFSIAAYLIAAGAIIHLFFNGQKSYLSDLFHWSVLALIVWNGTMWLVESRSLTR